MANKFLFDVDFARNQLLNAKLELLATDPTAPNSWTGRVIFNTTDQKFKYYNGTAWIAIGDGTLSNIINAANGGLTISLVGGTATIGVNVDDVTLTKITNVLQIKDGGVSAVKLASDAVTTIKVLDKAITFNKMQDVASLSVIGNMTGSSATPGAVSVITSVDLTGASNTNLATALAVKTYIDGRITSIGTLQGGFSASTETQFPGSPSVVIGSYWYVTTPGTVQGQVFNQGDVIIASKNNPSPTVAADWIFLESNRDVASTTVYGFIMLADNATVQAGVDAQKAVTSAGLASLTATETRRGLVERATTAEGLGLADTERFVSPAVLGAVLSAQFSANKYAGVIGNGTLTVIPVTHNLATKDIHLSLYEVATDTEVATKWRRTSINAVELSFTVAPATGALRLSIIKQ